MSLTEFNGWENFLDSEDDNPPLMPLSQKQQFQEYLFQLNTKNEAQQQPFEFLFAEALLHGPIGSYIY